jgi:predicted MFS family arabinose efflux permease
MTGIGIGIGMALGSFVSGWVVDTHGPGHGFWVSVVASLLALVTVLIGQKTLADPRGRAFTGSNPQLAE